jgi:thiamine biosynthesis lipoprotein
MPDTSPATPAAAIAAACRLVDQRRIAVTPARVRLGRGMALTLNGIAQGYITDRVVALLRDAGWSQVLVALGEIRALADHPDRRPWQIALPGGEGLAISDRAVATSAGAATRFEPSGHFHHLFSPATGQSAGDLNQVTVLAADATMADALATALYVMPADRRSACLAHFPGVEAFLVGKDGSSQRLPPA